MTIETLIAGYLIGSVVSVILYIRNLRKLSKNKHYDGDDFMEVGIIILIVFIFWWFFAFVWMLYVIGRMVLLRR